MSSPTSLENLTSCIGKRGLHAALFAPLKTDGLGEADFYQSSDLDQPYVVLLEEQGLELFLSCNKPPTLQTDSKATVQIKDGLWDLLGITLHTANSMQELTPWAGDWPGGIDPATLKRSRALEVFGPEYTAAGNLLMFEPDAKGLSVHCQFAKGNGELQTLSLYHSGAFVPEPVTPKTKPTAEEQGATPSPPPAPTCRSEEPTPVTGIYEAKLPAWHPDFAYYSAVRGRFCFKKQGEKMIRFGVVPFKDEALVVWTWIAGK